MSQIPTIKRHNPWHEIDMSASDLITKILANVCEISTNFLILTSLLMNMYIMQEM